MADVIPQVAPVPRKHVSMLVVVSLLAVLIVVIFGAAYYFMQSAGPVGNAIIPPMISTEQGNVKALDQEKSNDLGTTLYENSQNPLNDKLPEESAPVSNPLDDAYKNPFE